jgi:Tol biopolymer transport system component
MEPWWCGLSHLLPLPQEDQNLFWQPADGSSNAESLTSFSAYNHNLGSWSPDGQNLAFEEVNPKTKRDVWVLSVSDHKVRSLLNMQFNETAPQFSPDSRWLAYASDERSHPRHRRVHEPGASAG